MRPTPYGWIECVSAGLQISPAECVTLWKCLPLDVKQKIGSLLLMAEKSRPWSSTRRQIITKLQDIPASVFIDGIELAAREGKLSRQEASALQEHILAVVDATGGWMAPLTTRRGASVEPV
jgi:hypothetical protein